jgi:hypothetical protein
MGRLKYLIFISILFISTGCMNRGVKAHVDGILPASCLKGEIQLLNCDFTQKIPCRDIDISKVTYDPACIVINVKHEKK